MALMLVHLLCTAIVRQDSSSLTLRSTVYGWYGYYAQFCLGIERTEQGQYTGDVIGIDLGLKAFYTDQNGNTVECPKYLGKAEKRLSRKFKKGAKPQSKNYHKQKKRLGKAHLQVQRQRKDWAIKQAQCVVMSNDSVVYEDLQVQNLVKNHHLAKSIHDSSWSQFTQWLDYYGKVWDKAVVSTQDCANCGYRVRKSLSTRTHSCSKCGLGMDRDQNAALNILGMAWRNSTVGHTGTAPQGGTTGETSTSAMEGKKQLK